jgi:uncharacterized membrane protein
MSIDNLVVATYETHESAESAVKELQKAGFDMKKLSILGKGMENEQHVVGYYNAPERAAFWGKNGAFWGGLFGLLFGSAVFMLPGFGTLFVLGPLAGWIMGAIEGAVIVGGLSALGAALYSLGIPKNSVLQYETDIKMSKFLVLAHGTESEVEKARKILSSTATRAESHAVTPEPGFFKT